VRDAPNYPKPPLAPRAIIPNRYAWFNGVDPKAMRATDGTLEGAEQCVEVESYKGKQEWECE